MSIFPILQEHKIVAIVRGIVGEPADRAAEAMRDGGIRLIEVTMNTEGAAEIISRWRAKFDAEMRIGAGTVLNIGMAKEAVAAGAQYLISPNLDERVIQFGLDRGIDVWPGVMTPTEIVRAWEAGASAVKIFPMGALGLKYLQEIRAPLDHIPMIATGGVNLANISDFIAAGAAGVGLGSSLLDKQLVREGRFDELRSLAEKFTSAVRGSSH